MYFYFVAKADNVLSPASYLSFKYSGALIVNLKSVCSWSALPDLLLKNQPETAYSLIPWYWS